MLRSVSRRLGAVSVAVSVILFVIASSAQASSGVHYQLTTTFHVPVPADAIQNGWCYDTATVDPLTHRYYLADAANRQVTVIDPLNLNISGIGTGLFTGIGGCHQFNYDQQGPNGTAINRGRLFAGNGNSHVLVFSLTNGRRLANVNTGGALRADEMTTTNRDLVVTNPAETPAPYISFINLRTYRIDARFTFSNATAGLEQPQVWHSHLYISVPQTKQSPNGGEVDELDISNLARIRIIHRFPFTTCQPAGLDIRPDGLAAVGCAGPEQEILNLNNGHETPVTGVSGVDIVSVRGPDFFFVSYLDAEFFIANSQGKVLQTFPATSASHTVTADPVNGNVWVPQDKGDVNVYSPAGG